MLQSLLHSLSLLLGAVLLFGAARVLYALFITPRLFELSNPLRNLPRVKKRPSLIIGVNDEIAQSINPGAVEGKWMKDRNSTVVAYPSYLGTHSLYVADPLALHHIFMKNEGNYPKAQMRTRLLAMAVGQGLVTTQGDLHRKQRRMLTPAFQLQHLRTFVPEFLKCGSQLVEALKNDTSLHDRYDESKFPHVVDLSKYAEAATLDLIGMTGFHYDFGAMKALREGKKSSSALEQGLKDAMTATLNASPLDKLITLVGSVLFPSLATMPITPSNRAWRSARKRMEQVTKEILDQRLEQVKQDLSLSGKKIGKAASDEAVFAEKDLLTLLLRANLAIDTKPHERLDQTELLGQLTTFLLAGHETTSAATTWLLFYLSTHPEAQRKVHDEIDALYDRIGGAGNGDDADCQPTWDDLSEMTYMNACLQESQRLKPSIPMSHRDVLQDDIVPLSRPQPSSDGKSMVDSMHIPAKSVIIIGIAAINRSTEIWGPDAEEFRPERWLDLPETLQASRPPPTKTYTFLHGKRNCIGWRYAQMEVQCLVLSILRKYELRQTGEQVTSQVARIITGKPVVVGKEHDGAQMPISLAERSTT